MVCNIHLGGKTFSWVTQTPQPLLVIHSSRMAEWSVWLHLLHPMNVLRVHAEHVGWAPGLPASRDKLKRGLTGLPRAVQEDGSGVLLKRSWVAFLWRSLDPLFRFQQKPLLKLLLLMKQKKGEDTPITLDREVLQAPCWMLSELVVV